MDIIAHSCFCVLTVKLNNKVLLTCSLQYVYIEKTNSHFSHLTSLRVVECNFYYRVCVQISYKAPLCYCASSLTQFSFRISFIILSSVELSRVENVL